MTPVELRKFLETKIQLHACPNIIHSLFHSNQIILFPIIDVTKPRPSSTVSEDPSPSDSVGFNSTISALAKFPLLTTASAT
jgi:hypothetical protein